MGRAETVANCAFDRRGLSFAAHLCSPGKSGTCCDRRDSLKPLRLFVQRRAAASTISSSDADFPDRPSTPSLHPHRICVCVQAIHCEASATEIRAHCCRQPKTERRSVYEDLRPESGPTAFHHIAAVCPSFNASDHLVVAPAPAQSPARAVLADRESGPMRSGRRSRCGGQPPGVSLRSLLLP